MIESLRTGNLGLVSPDEAVRMSGVDFLKAMRERKLPAPPFAGTTDIWLSEVEAGRVVFEAEPSSRFYNPLSTVHGGWTSALLDSAMACAVHSRLAAGQTYTTVDMTVNFVRAIQEKTGLLRCEGKVIHFGSRMATSEGRVWDAAGRIVAHGTETCMIFPTVQKAGSSAQGSANNE